MQTVYSDDHRSHAPKREMTDGDLVPAFEKPERADMVLAAVREAGLGEILAPKDFGLEPLAAVHDDDYLDFLASAWDDWRAEHDSDEAFPFVWPARGLRQGPAPSHIDGRLGHYSFDAGTPIGPGTWKAAQTSAQVALSAQALVADGARAAFALCRPPGHHAAAGTYGGYCFLNNAAIAAQAFRDRGAGRVAVLDVDYHHGNGTQAIFYRRPDVYVASIHADPRQEYPYFLGHADETGAEEGEGANLNFPLPWGTDSAAYLETLQEACRRIAEFGAEAVVVSLGVDTYFGDPISRFRLESSDFPKIGETIARLGRPTLFCMEGGYAVREIGINAAGVLSGFEQA
ncbi:MAG: histone deacetylase family protein [Rhodovibrionaceae bacterium]|nr:histone deacetylase family protein [Rhodovibrionaceae bacterium]